jgi:hypothetical protein
MSGNYHDEVSEYDNSNLNLRTETRQVLDSCHASGDHHLPFASTLWWPIQFWQGLGDLAG